MEIQATRLPRSGFDLSFRHTTTMDAAYLYPLYTEEVLPGDTFSIRPSVVFRLTTPFKPFMDELRMDWQFFYVPFRLLWTNFTKMMGERVDPADHIDYQVPQISVNMAPGTVIKTLFDYFDTPANGGTKAISAFYSRAYNLIWNEWYRDENLQDSVHLDTGDGPDNPVNYTLLRRGKRKDYIWGALPFAQKGDPVSLPLADTAPVVSTGAQIEWATASDGSQAIRGVTAGVTPQRTTGTWSATEAIFWGDESGLEADLASATAVTINQLRTAVATQHLLERDARGGSRYRELVLSHWGVQTDDIRLMRPRLIGAGSARMQVSQVPATRSDGSALEFLGDLGGFGHTAAMGRSFRETFTEHGLIMGLFSVRTEVSLQQGLARRLSRKTRYDFAHPDFYQLGEQAVLSQEVYCDGTGDPDLGTFDYSVWGYAPRYEEYRHRQDIVSGEFRSQYAQSQDIWHLGLEFSSRPSLNATYIQEDPPIDRVVVFNTIPHFRVSAHFGVRAARMMPRFANPGLLRF